MRITDFFIRRAQLRELGKNPQLITAVENPSEKMQLAAVRQNPDLVSVLDNPTYGRGTAGRCQTKGGLSAPAP